jgi:hypothetical protein
LPLASRDARIRASLACHLLIFWHTQKNAPLSTQPMAFTPFLSPADRALPSLLELHQALPSISPPADKLQLSSSTTQSAGPPGRSFERLLTGVIAIPFVGFPANAGQAEPPKQAPSGAGPPPPPVSQNAAPGQRGISVQVEGVGQAAGDEKEKPELPEWESADPPPLTGSNKPELPAKLFQPIANLKPERDTDYPEDSLQTLPHLPLPMTANVLVLAQGMTTADKTNKLDPAAAATEKIASVIVAQAETTGNDEPATLQLQLDHPVLGVVRVHLIVNDRAVSARMMVQEESTRQLLEGQVGLLRDRLNEAGMILSRFSVTRDGGGSDGEQRHAPPEESPAWAVPPFNGRAPNASAPSRGNGPRGAIDVIV